MAARIRKDEFDAQVLKSEIPVLVDFYTDSCIACKQISPLLGDLEDSYQGKLKVVKVNAAFDTELAETYNVMGAPTLVFFKEGNEVKRYQGVVSKDLLEQTITENI